MHMFSITFPHCICMKMIRSLWYHTLWIFVSLGFNLVDHIAWTQLSFPISFLFFWRASIYNNLLTYIIRKYPYEKKRRKYLHVSVCMYYNKSFLPTSYHLPMGLICVLMAICSGVFNTSTRVCQWDEWVHDPCYPEDLWSHVGRNDILRKKFLSRFKDHDGKNWGQ